MTRSEEIKTLLYQDLETALRALSEEAKGTRYESTGIIFLSEINGMNKRILNGLMSDHDIDRRKAGLISRASSLLGSLERDYPERINRIVSNSPNSSPDNDTSERKVDKPDEITSGRKVGSLKAFVSFAEEDEAFRLEFEKYLKLMERNGILGSWKDGKVYAGQVWGSNVRNYLEEADVIFLLISINFMNNERILEKQLPVALKRHEEGKARVIPIILQVCPWQEQEFAKLEAANKQVIGEPDNNLGWTQVFMEISLSLKNFLEE